MFSAEASRRPCQDVSLAGRRRGLKEGTRSGLWSEFARLIDTVRPDWVVIENVRGLLSADAAGDVEPCPWCLGDDGEQHALRALGAVLGDLADLGFDAEWTGLRAADVGAPHGRLRVFILAWPAERTVADASDRTGDGRWARPESGPRGSVADLTLLTTPAASLVNDGESPESWLARRERVKATGVNGNGMGMPLPIAVQLLPTPGAYDGARGGSQHPDKRREGGHSVSLQDAAEHLLPTPTTTNRSGNDRNSRGELLLPGVAREHANDWGPYAAAIARWEQVTGRPAPSPVRFDGKGGKPRMNPELTEWMMGWDEGWVTSPEIGLTRSEQLKACGNGVVTLQAIFALRVLLSRPGVPAIRAEVAA